MDETRFRLLRDDDPPPVAECRPRGRSLLFITCEHAGRAIPRALGRLGLADGELERHIAWDIGAAAVARGLSEALDAHLVEQTYSRLVIDCNRAPHRPDAVATLSEHTEIPGNRDLPAHHVTARVEEVFQPYHDRIAGSLDRRAKAGHRTVLLAMHSFTPVYKGARRPWHVGLLYNRDDRLARILKDLMRADRALCVGDNEPYAISDESDYTIPVHGERRGIPHVEIEVRQDLIDTAAGEREWTERLAEWMTVALERLGEPARV